MGLRGRRSVCSRDSTTPVSSTRLGTGQKGEWESGGVRGPGPGSPLDDVLSQEAIPSGAGGHRAENNLPHLLVSEFKDLTCLECFLL